MNPAILLLLLLLVIVIFGITIVYIVSKEKSKKSRIMNVIHGGQVNTKSSDADLRNKRREDIAKKLKESEDEEGEDGKKDRVTTAMLISQAGMKVSAKAYWIGSIIFAVIVTLLVFTITKKPLLTFFILVICLFGLPRYFLKMKAARRQKKFLEEFPDSLEATVRLLKAGMPISEAIQMISKEYDGPVGEEMSIVYNKQKIGIPLHEAAMEATRRIPLPEMHMFATGLAIQAQTGASLSEVLMNLSGVIRARFRLKRKVKALSSEAIASASIIGALPNVVAGGLWLVNPEYISLLFTHPTGKMLLTGAVVWMLIGVLVMRGMINFKI